MKRETRHRCRLGFTVVELMIAATIGLVVVLALGKIILVNQRSWVQGQDKMVMQQNATEALEWMARSIRAARSLTVGGADSFSTFDVTGMLVHTYQRVGEGAAARLQEDGRDLIGRPCTQFAVTTNADTTSLTLTVEFADAAGNRVGGMTRSTIRNGSFEF